MELVQRLRELAEDLTAHDWTVLAAPAADALEAKDAEIAALRKDAERYRWLRAHIERQRLVIAKSCGWDGLKSWSGDDPDKHIDAAMAKAKSIGAA